MQLTNYTYDDLVEWPDDGLRHELIDGTHFVSPSPVPRHQLVSKRLFRRLEDHFEPAGTGAVFYAPVDVILTPQDVVVPDLVVVSQPEFVTERAIEGPPMLVVEVLSRSSQHRDRRLKFRRYAELGIAHYWIADPDAGRLECYRLTNGRYESVARAGDESLRHPDFPALVVTPADLA